MKFKVIASGSKGNCTYVECGETRFLIDIGISYLQVQNALKDIDVQMSNLDFILITHTHNDHIKGLASLLKKTNIILYSSPSIYDKLSSNIEIKNYHLFELSFDYKGINIEAFSLSHDVECYGFLIRYNEKELVYITDTGYLNKRYYDLLSNKHVYIIEANHDERMLMDGPYPYILKQRIIGDRGHLSNSTTGTILRKLVGNNTKYVLLAHISEHNNTKELAFSQVKEKLLDLNFSEDKLLLTDQYESLDMLEV